MRYCLSRLGALLAAVLLCSKPAVAQEYTTAVPYLEMLDLHLEGSFSTTKALARLAFRPPGAQDVRLLQELQRLLQEDLEGVVRLLDGVQQKLPNNAPLTLFAQLEVVRSAAKNALSSTERLSSLSENPEDRIGLQSFLSELVYYLDESDTALEELARSFGMKRVFSLPLDREIIPGEAPWEQIEGFRRLY